MRKLFYVTATLLFFAGGLTAQQDNIDKKAMSKPVKASPVEFNSHQVETAQTKDPEIVIFSEDFANGLDGNNELGQPWGTGGEHGFLWKQSFTGPWGLFSTTIGPLESATMDNGFMILDADSFNVDDQGNYTTINVNGWMQTPPLDMSDLNSVLVDFTTYFRWCCYNATPVFISVSTDGGTTWTNFKPWNYGQFIEGANNYSGTLNVTTDISPVAANESNVLIRFGYLASEAAFGTSFTHYFYGVDDVSVYENPNANNLSVLQVMNGDVVNLWEFKNYPLEQSGELMLGAVYGNFGSETQTDVTVTWDIMLGDNVIHTSSVNLGDVPTTRLDADGAIIQNIDTAWVESGFAISDIGDYTIRATIAANEDEEVPEDNVLERDIKVTDALMSHDDMDNDDIQYGPRDADEGEGFLFEEVGYGAMFFVVNPGSMAYGLQVVFGDNTTPGSTAFIEFYEVDPEQGINGPSENMPSEFPLTDGEIALTEDEFNVPVFVPFYDPVDLEVGKIYFACVRQFEGDEETWVRATANADTDNSSYVREKGGSGEYFWFSRPGEVAVRLAFSTLDAVNELAKENMKLNVSPNPASSYVNLSYELESSKKVSYSLYDVNGRIIVNEVLGSQSQGSHTARINTSALDAGVYYLIIKVGDDVASEKIIISE